MTEELLWALEVVLKKEHLGDYIYNVREREGEGWEGPRVVQFGKAVNVLEQHYRLLREANP